MKPQIYFRLALLTPYILWCICILIVLLLSSQATSGAWNILLMPLEFYSIGIIFWVVPYTLLAVGMWIWSRKKSTGTLFKLALSAPLLFVALMLIEVVLIFLPGNGAAEFTRNFLGSAALISGFSLVFAYLCVGIALAFFKFLQRKNLIAEEISTTNFEVNQIPTLV